MEGERKKMKMFVFSIFLYRHLSFYHHRANANAMIKERNDIIYLGGTFHLCTSRGGRIIHILYIIS